jgi:hypothetical protein
VPKKALDLKYCLIQVKSMGLERGRNKSTGPNNPDSPTSKRGTPQASPDANDPKLDFDGSPLPEHPDTSPLKDYLIRVRAVAEVIAKICAKHQRSVVDIGDKGFTLKLNRTSSQIDETGALVLYISNIQIGKDPYHKVELVTPIGAICCFRPDAELPSAALAEIGERFGLSENEVAPGCHLVLRDDQCLEFANKWSPTSPGDFKNGTEFAQYSWIFD